MDPYFFRSYTVPTRQKQCVIRTQSTEIIKNTGNMPNETTITTTTTDRTDRPDTTASSADADATADVTAVPT